MSQEWMRGASIEALVDDVTQVNCNCGAEGCETRLFYGASKEAAFVQVRHVGSQEEVVKLPTADDVANFIARLKKGPPSLFTSALEQDLPVLFARNVAR